MVEVMKPYSSYPGGGIGEVNRYGACLYLYPLGGVPAVAEVVLGKILRAGIADRNSVTVRCHLLSCLCLYVRLACGEIIYTACSIFISKKVMRRCETFSYVEHLTGHHGLDNTDQIRQNYPMKRGGGPRTLYTTGVRRYASAGDFIS